MKSSMGRVLTGRLALPVAFVLYCLSYSAIAQNAAPPASKPLSAGPVTMTECEQDISGCGRGRSWVRWVMGAGRTTRLRT